MMDAFWTFNLLGHRYFYKNFWFDWRKKAMYYIHDLSFVSSCIKTSLRNKCTDKFGKAWGGINCSELSFRINDDNFHFWVNYSYVMVSKRFISKIHFWSKCYHWLLVKNVSQLCFKCFKGFKCIRLCGCYVVTKVLYSRWIFTSKISVQFLALQN